MDAKPQDKTSASNPLEGLSPIDAQFIAKLERLAELKAKGTLSETEFLTQKSVALSQWRPTLDKAGRKADAFIRNITECELISGILWISIAWFQMNSWWFAIAGVWNLGIGAYRLHTSVRIRMRDARIPEGYEGIALLAATALVNIFLGGIFGIVCAGFDYYIRSQILKHREVFNALPPPETPSELKSGEKALAFDAPASGQSPAATR